MARKREAETIYGIRGGGEREYVEGGEMRLKYLDSMGLVFQPHQLYVIGALKWFDNNSASPLARFYFTWNQILMHAFNWHLKRMV